MQRDGSSRYRTCLFRAIGALVLAFAVLTPTPAVAGEPTDPDAGHRSENPARALAKERYKKGVEAYGAGRYKDAIDLFLEANQLSPEPTLSYNIGIAYQDMGDVAAAMRWFRDYLRRAPVAKDRADVEKRVDGLQQHLRKMGVQQVTVLSTPEGATVVMDGRPVGVTPWTGEIPPGTHNVALQLRGYSDGEKRFELLEHRAMDVGVVLSATPPISPLPTSPPIASSPHLAGASSSAALPSADKTLPDREGRSPGFITWGVLGISAATLIGALGFELARRSAETDARDSPTQVGAIDRYDAMISRQTTSRVLAGIGAATLIAGGTLLYFDLSSDRPGKTSAAGQARIGVGCHAPGCGANVIIKFF
jgi:tetratricopeptide (TPR) repeat protein